MQEVPTNRVALLKEALFCERLIARQGTRRHQLCEEAVSYGLMVRGRQTAGVVVYYPRRDPILAAIDEEL